MSYLHSEDQAMRFYVEMMEAIKGNQEYDFTDLDLIEDILMKLTDNINTPVKYDEELIEWMMSNSEEDDIREYILYKGMIKDEY